MQSRSLAPVVTRLTLSFALSHWTRLSKSYNTPSHVAISSVTQIHTLARMYAQPSRIFPVIRDACSSRVFKEFQNTIRIREQSVKYENEMGRVIWLGMDKILDSIKSQSPIHSRRRKGRKRGIKRDDMNGNGKTRYESKQKEKEKRRSIIMTHRVNINQPSPMRINPRSKCYGVTQTRSNFGSLALTWPCGSNTFRE